MQLGYALARRERARTFSLTVRTDDSDPDLAYRAFPASWVGHPSHSGAGENWAGYGRLILRAANTSRWKTCTSSTGARLLVSSPVNPKCPDLPKPSRWTDRPLPCPAGPGHPPPAPGGHARVSIDGVSEVAADPRLPNLSAASSVKDGRLGGTSPPAPRPARTG